MERDFKLRHYQQPTPPPKAPADDNSETETLGANTGPLIPYEIAPIPLPHCGWPIIGSIVKRISRIPTLLPRSAYG